MKNMKNDLTATTKFGESVVWRVACKLHLRPCLNPVDVKLGDNEALVTAEAYGAKVQEADVLREVNAVLADINHDLPENSYLDLSSIGISYVYGSPVYECKVAITIACYCNSDF